MKNFNGVMACSERQSRTWVFMALGFTHDQAFDLSYRDLVKW